MRFLLKLLLGLFLWAAVVTGAQDSGFPKEYLPAVVLGFPVVYWLLVRRKRQATPSVIVETPSRICMRKPSCRTMGVVSRESAEYE
jgi:hypothetical protein